MSLISLPYTFSVGAVIIAAQHNSNFQTIYNDYNGNITDANIASNAAIEYSKLSLNNSILSGDIKSTEIFAIGNIPTGTTANKVVKLDNSAKLPAVDGSALTNLTISGILGAWASKSVTTIYQAATDGFAVGYASAAAVTLLTDSSATPTTIRSAFNPGSGGGTGAVFSPVKKNDYYQFTGTLTAGFFIPLGT